MVLNTQTTNYRESASRLPGRGESWQEVQKKMTPVVGEVNDPQRFIKNPRTLLPFSPWSALAAACGGFLAWQTTVGENERKCRQTRSFVSESEKGFCRKCDRAANGNIPPDM